MLQPFFLSACVCREGSLCSGIAVPIINNFATRATVRPLLACVRINIAEQHWHTTRYGML